MKRIAVVCLLIALDAVAVSAAAPVLLWSDRYDGGASSNDQALLVRVGPDGQPVVAGTSHDGIDGSDILVRKLDRLDGHLIWERRIASGEINDITVTEILFDGAANLLLGGHVLGCDG